MPSTPSLIIRGRRFLRSLAQDPTARRRQAGPVDERCKSDVLREWRPELEAVREKGVPYSTIVNGLRDEFGFDVTERTIRRVLTEDV
jgi:hypothetical protein